MTFDNAITSPAEDEDSVRSNDHGYYYEGCYQVNGCGRGQEDGESRGHCHTCEQPRLNMNLWTERFLCDCETTTAHNAGEPVHYADSTLARRVLATIRMAA